MSRVTNWSGGGSILEKGSSSVKAQKYEITEYMRGTIKKFDAAGISGMRKG